MKAQKRRFNDFYFRFYFRKIIKYSRFEQEKKHQNLKNLKKILKNKLFSRNFIFEYKEILHIFFIWPIKASHAWSKLKSNWGMLKDLLPVDFVAGWVVKDEFREFLIRRFELAFDSKKEFTKLWKRIDLNGFNAVKGEDITKRIAGPVRPFSSEESRAKRKPNKFSDITVIEKKSAEAEDSVPKTAGTDSKANIFLFL